MLNQSIWEQVPQAGFTLRWAQAASPGLHPRNCGPGARGVEGIAQGPTSRTARGARHRSSSLQEAASTRPFVSLRGCQAASVSLPRGSLHPSASARSFLSPAAPGLWGLTGPSTSLLPALRRLR